ncbi:M13 family metallopeptidase [Salinisphaera sp. Q1T1-3]|uniref:M13 family metallopeptidase n=1 Tax=Salinisphaera sp. Q1T1-3 TaxID=2321229 RepID=UPI000E74C25A|nr:M13 family metallopeptidase [Salinisphaera sp. Q1T1-3]RJS93385.1 M13 family peptidase [Salinisphaera sp. Q1T1-3]
MTRDFLRPTAVALGLMCLNGVAMAQGNESPPESDAPAAKTDMSVAKNVFDTSELDTDANVCQNLDDFVNAKWIAANPIPDDHTRWGAFNELAEKSLKDQHTIVEAAEKTAGTADADSVETQIGHLYASAMDTAAIDKAGDTPVKSRLARIQALDSRDAIARYLTLAFAEGQGQVFSMDASPDYKNAKQVIAYVYQGGLSLPTPKYYTDKDYAEQRQAYVAYLTKLFSLIGQSDDEAAHHAEAAMAFETKLAKHSLSQVAMRDPDNQYHFVTLDEANKATPHFDWKAFWAAQGADIKKGFSLSEPKFFAEFERLLANASIDEWKAYLTAHTIDDAAPLLAKRYRDAHFAFYGTELNGQPQQKPRWKQSLDAVNSAMGQGLGQLYVAKYFPPQAKARAEELVDNIRAALKTRIQNNDWMSDTTKDKALDKWSKFLAKIGYPEHWRSWKGLSIQADDFYGNMTRAAKFNHDYEMAYVGQPRDRQRWGMTPQTVNAYYNPTDNTINFPAAILQPPFFYAHGDDAVNYGGIGAVIGHESSHGYDDQGSQFDGDGNQNDWWTAADRKAFDARTAKLVDQFNQYTPIPGKPGVHVNGKLTLGENIADLDGLTLAYDALQKALAADPTEAKRKIDGYTQDQRFFMAWARVWRGHSRPKALAVQLNSDPHSPMTYRAIGAPSNMPAFAKAFDCKPGDAMVRPPKKRVEIW